MDSDAGVQRHGLCLREPVRCGKDRARRRCANEPSRQSVARRCARRTRHQPEKVVTRDVNQRQVVARLEIDVLRADQALIDDCFNAIRLAQRRDGSGLAVLEQSRKLLAGGVR
jgi:hypothetical protein